MPSKAKRVERDVDRLPSIPPELVAHFLNGPMTGEAINLAAVALKKALTVPTRRERREAPTIATVSPPSRF
jgi:hypothetical protein